MKILRIVARTADGLETVIKTSVEDEPLDIHEVIPLGLEVVEWYVVS